MSSPDLELERQRSALSARQLAFVLHGGRANVERLEHLESLLAADPVFANPQEMYYLPREQQYRRATKMAGRAEILARRNGLSEEDTALLHVVLQSLTGYPSSTALHTGMFFKNLALLFTDEQQQQWMALAKQWRMVGCYAQTELGHGSNVRGLETTATYIPETDEFEIHSPTLTSIKWWPGALARTANFAVVYARLILADGRDYGVHNFMVQLRDLETHAPLAGVTLGDIGPKIGFNNVDNGYCRFTKVRIPREQMGMRVSKVTREGKYVKQAGVPQEVLYFTMLQTRMDFVRLAGLSLAKACTIAIRYSVVRQQGYDANAPKSTKELSVLDYQTQQYRLLPLLAASYAITLNGNYISAFKRELSEQIHNGNTSMLSVGHAMSCGLKVLASDIAGSGMEACRRACGGHGYLLASGIPALLGDMVQLVTAEGENFVLTIQTSRALLKVLAAFRKSGQVPDSMHFIADIGSVQSRAAARTAARTKQQWLDSKVYVDAYQQRFLYLLSGLERKVAASASTTAGIQNHSVHCYQLSMAYSKLVLASSFADSVQSAASLSSEKLETASTAVRVVRSLCHLFALTQLQQDAGEFMESGALSPADMPLIRENIEDLLRELRPHAVTLVDGFNFSDRTLNSALGRYDGKVYEALYETAQLERLNSGKVGVDSVSGDGAVALRELLLPIREEIARIESERRSRL